MSKEVKRFGFTSDNDLEETYEGAWVLSTDYIKLEDENRTNADLRHDMAISLANSNIRCVQASVEIADLKDQLENAQIEISRLQRDAEIRIRTFHGQTSLNDRLSDEKNALKSDIIPLLGVLENLKSRDHSEDCESNFMLAEFDETVEDTCDCHVEMCKQVLIPFNKKYGTLK